MTAKTWLGVTLATTFGLIPLTASAQVSNNSISISFSGGGVKAGSVVVRDGQPKGRVLLTESNVTEKIAYPSSVVMQAVDGGVRSGIAESTAVSGGSQGTVVAIFLGNKPLLPGTYSGINSLSAAFAAFPFQPAFAIGNISADPTTGQLCPSSNRAATASITIAEVQVEQLEKRFHVLKLTASIDGRCTANGETFHAVMRADEPSLGGTLLTPPAVNDTPTPPPPVSELPRTHATYTLSMTSDKTANIGGVGGGKSYSITQRDASQITSFARARTGAEAGAPPTTIGIKLESTPSASTRTGVSAMALTMRTATEFVVGQTYTGGDTGGFENGRQDTQFELQMNSFFCAGGIFSTYTVDDLTYDCESIPSPLNNGTVAVAPHIRSMRVSFTTRCGNQAGGFKGTLTFNDPVVGNEDCANPITGAPPVTTPTTPTTPTDPSVPAPSTPSTPSTPTPPSTPTLPSPTPSNAPGVIIPGDLRSNGLVLANAQSATVTITTVTPSSVAGPVSLSVVSDPPGLDVSISPSRFNSGNGDSVITITAGPNTRPQDYTVTIAATGISGTSFTSFIVSIVCDPPVILGINQPKNVTVNRGASTTLDVTANGSAPLNYQWYAGDSGNTASPVAGAKGRTFTTPALNAAATYWVRVSNACGSTDSNSVTVSVR